MRCPKCGSVRVFYYDPADATYREYTCWDCLYTWKKTTSKKKEEKKLVYEITITDESVLDLIRHDDRVLKIRRISGK